MIAIRETTDWESTIEITEDSDLNGSSAGDAPLDGAKAGDIYTKQDLLYSMVLASDPNAAELFAVDLGGGDSSSFISRMNDWAKNAGTKSTNMVNTDGSSDSNNYTSARDMAAIAVAALNDSLYSKIAFTSSYTIAADKDRSEIDVWNNNQLSDSDSSFYIDGAYGLKYAEGESGCNLIGVLENGDMDVVFVLLGASESEEIYTDAENICDWVSSTCSLTAVPEEGNIVMTLPVEMPSSEDENKDDKSSEDENIDDEENSDEDISDDESSDESSGEETSSQPTVDLAISGSLEKLLPKKVSASDVTLICRVPATVKAPVAKGDYIGIADVMYEGERIATVDLEAVNAVTVGSKKGGGVGRVLLIIFIVLASLFAVLYIIRCINIYRYRKIRQKKLEAKRRRQEREMREKQQMNAQRRQRFDDYNL